MNPVAMVIMCHFLGGTTTPPTPATSSPDPTSSAAVTELSCRMSVEGAC